MKLMEIVVNDKITTKKMIFFFNQLSLHSVFDNRPGSVAVDYRIHDYMYFLQKDLIDLVKFGRRFMGHPCTITRLFTVFPCRWSHWQTSVPILRCKSDLCLSLCLLIHKGIM